MSRVSCLSSHALARLARRESIRLGGGHRTCHLATARTPTIHPGELHRVGETQTSRPTPALSHSRLSKRQKTTMNAVSGTARKTPEIPPRTAPQKTSEKITAKLLASPATQTAATAQTAPKSKLRFKLCILHSYFPATRAFLTQKVFSESDNTPIFRKTSADECHENRTVQRDALPSSPVV